MGLQKINPGEDVNVVGFSKPYSLSPKIIRISFLFPLHCGNSDFHVLRNGFHGREGLYGGDSEILKLVLEALFQNATGVESARVSRTYIEVRLPVALSEEALEKLVLQACRKHNEKFRKVDVV